MNLDPYECGKPKYATAQDVRDALYALVYPEEIEIVSEFAPDVSWENQDSIYTQKATQLLEKFDALSDYGQKMWLMELAVVKLDGQELHWTVWEALRNEDLAKCLSFKKTFTDKLLGCNKAEYRTVKGEWEDVTYDLDDVDFVMMMRTLKDTLIKYDSEMVGVCEYAVLLSAIAVRLDKLELTEERVIIFAARELLTSHDDFLNGLRCNQELFNEQKTRFNDKLKALQAAYDRKVAMLTEEAQRKGVVLKLGNGTRFLGGGEVIDVEAEVVTDSVTYGKECS